jgi:glutamate dehydrogenase
MIEEGGGGRITSWSVELGDGDLALIRYTLDGRPPRAAARRAALDRKLDEMVRGWEPSVEEALGGDRRPARATRLALSYMDDFPKATAPAPPRRGGEDILRICAGRRPRARDARSTARRATRRPAAPQDLPRGGVIPLSEAVPVFENFGFRVLEEQPTALDGGELGYIHDFVLEMPGGRRRREC